METKEVSKCCHDTLVEDYKDNPRDHHDPTPIYTCAKCKLECEVEEVCAECAECNGTGEVSVEEQVYPGEPHTASIGTRKCICQLGDADDYQEQD